MIVIILGAILTALVTLYLLRPLERRGRMVLAVLIPLAALGLYLWQGNPDIPSAAALFEGEGPRAEQRSLLVQELALMEGLSQTPDDLGLMLALGATRMQAGRIDEAVRILEHARQQAPDHPDVLTELGAAYYAQAVMHLIAEEPDQGLERLYQAQAVAPDHAPYKAQLEADIARLIAHGTGR